MIEKKFYSPVIKEDDIFDENLSDKEIWIVIKSDCAAIGFYYLIGEENG